MSIPDDQIALFVPTTRVPELKAALQQSGTTRRRLHLARWSAMTLGAVLATLFVFALLDYGLVLPLWMRFGCVLLLIGELAAGIILLLRGRKAYADPIVVAREVEDSDPRLGCLLSTAIEYGQWDQAQFTQWEATLVDELLQKARKERSAVWPSLWRSIRVALGIVAGAALLVLLFVLFAPQSSIALRRSLTPWTQAAYTTIVVTPGNADIPEGRDVEISVTFAGRLPPEAQIAYREEGQSWKTVPLRKASATQYHHQFVNVRGTILYHIVARKVDCPTFRLEAFRPPEVRAWKIRLKYPQYTALPERVQNLPDLSVLRGTQITFVVEMSEQVKHIAIDTGGKERLDLTSEPADSGSVSLTAKESFPYWLEVTDLKGRLTRSATPNQLVVLPDQAPKVNIVSPGKNTRLRADQKQPLEIEGSDDFGLASLRIVAKRLGNEPTQIDCPPQDQGGGRFTAKATLDPAAMGCKVGDVIVYYALATDRNDIDGPGQGKSSIYFIEVTAPPREGQPQDQQDQNQGQQQNRKQQIDLYELEKQILQATMLAGEDASAESLRQLGAQQTEIQQLGARFREIIEGEGVKDPKLLGLVDQARDAMAKAAQSLNTAKAEPAIGHEEIAVQNLAELMSIIRPDILMRANQQLRKEMVKQETEKERKQQEELPKMLQQVNQMAQEQTKLNQEQQPQDNAEQQQQDQQQQDPQNADQQNKDDQKPDERDAAERQKDLAQRAEALAEKARRLNLAQVPQKLDDAQKAMVEGKGQQGVKDLLDAATALKLLQGRGMPDVAAEAYPGEYENMIASYFRKLSKEE